MYIKKKGLSNDLKKKIIEIRKSDTWKMIKDGDTEAVRRVFDNEFPKNDVKAVLVNEQGGLCAYCMRRIRMDSHSRIEHLVPLCADKEKAIDYNNMLGVCDGGERIAGGKEHILCCDAHKKETEVHISPLDRVQMNKIAYKKDETIYTKPRDDIMEKDINETLLLNGIRKSDGSVRDTSTELLKGRRDAYKRVCCMLDTLDQKGKCTSASIKKITANLQSAEEREEYLGVMLYHLGRKYNELIKRGI